MVHFTYLKDSDYIGIFYCFCTFGTILNIIILLSANLIASYLLKNCYTDSLQTSHTGRPLCYLVQGLLLESIRIASRDLECVMFLQFFLHISRTYHPIIKFNTSTHRSLLVLYFIFFELRVVTHL